MTTLTVSDEMHDALVVLYGAGSISSLLRQYYLAFPTSGKWGTTAFLTWMRSRGAVGASYQDVALDFWKRRL